MRRSSLWIAAAFTGAAVFGLAGMFWDVDAFAQVSRTRTTRNAGAVKQLDARASDVLKSFVDESANLAKEYEGAGEPGKAKEILEAVVAVYPEATGIKDKIKQLQEQILTSNDLEVDVDVSRNWSTPVARVSKGEQFRIQVDGTYKFTTSLSVGAEGFPTKDVTKGDMAADIPCGALMGIIVVQGQKDPKPFLIGEGRDMTPEEDGVLFLGVNAPGGARCTGRLKATLSGSVTKL